MRRNRNQLGFSLVEVTLALGIAAFCIIPIFALIPIGLSSNRDTLRETTAASLAAAISTDLRATPTAISNSPFYQLAIPASGGGQTTTNFLVTDDGARTNAPAVSRPTYLATVVLTPPSETDNMQATTALIMITWPANSSQTGSGSIPTQYLGKYQTVIALNRN